MTRPGPSVTTADNNNSSSSNNNKKEAGAIETKETRRRNGTNRVIVWQRSSRRLGRSLTGKLGKKKLGTALKKE